ncbi:MAG: protein kinase [Polyangiales bacterium]
MLVLGDDRFELRRLIGEGSYGEVYEAFDFASDRRVAVKLMVQTGRAADARFAREVALLAELDHPHIVRYLAHGQTPGGQSYLVMEWLQGEPLDLRLRRKQMELDEVLALARSVASGLGYAAARGITHRDIKPGNLYLIERDCAASKILDLGLARHTLDQQLTRTGALVGTPLYMSPEQARGARDIDPRSDVFSLGSVLYECLCIDRPFEGAHPMATLAKICMEEPVPIEVNAPMVPARLAALVHAMLHKDREQRPSYATLTQELDAIARGAPAPGAQTRSLRSKSEQRVLCAVFVGAGAELDPKRFGGARHEQLLDGSHILLFDAHANALDQALRCARCALSLGTSAAVAVCTGKARVGDGGPLLGELLERGVELLLQTAPGTIRVDADSEALLAARFELGADHTLLRERSAGEAPRTLLGQPTRFVGRDRELAQLTLSFRDCVEEQVARAVLVSAAAGAGKSRLRHELVESVRGQPVTLLVARGDAMRTGQQLGMLAGVYRTWRAEGELAGLLPPARAALVGAFLGELIGLPFDEARDPQLAAARRDPALLAERMQESWLEWLRALCERGPVLLCVEDLHWSDPASVRALDQALRNLAQRPLLLVAFARPEVRELFPNLWLERDLTELRLPKLTARHCERVLESVLPNAAASLRQALIERADGNPFFLEELVRALQAGETELPDTVLGVVQARLDHLGDELKQVIRAGSVFGAQFTAEGVRALLGVSPALSDHLRMLVEREVIFARGGDEFGFRHALIRDAAYELLDRELRETAHRAAASWLTQRGAPAAVLGEHWERGGMPEQAAPSYRQAALEALEACSFEQTLRWGERVQACGASGEVLGETSAAMALACSCMLHEDDAVRWGELAQSNLDPLHPAWWRAAQAATVAEMRLDRPERATQRFDQMETALPSAPMSMEQISAISIVLAESERLLHPTLRERAAALLPKQAPETLHGRARGYMNDALSFYALSQGRRDEALHYARAAIEAFRALGAKLGLIEVLGHTGYLLYELGAFDEAEWTFLEQRQLSRDGTLLEYAYAGFYLALLHMRRGQLPEAEPLLLEAMRATDAAHERVHQQETRAALAELRIQEGRLDDARQIVDEALHIHDEVHAPALATVYVAQVRLELASGAPERALAQVERAMALVEQHGNRIEAAGRLHALHLDCLLACGRRAEAELASQRANAWLERRLAQIADPGLRAGFARLSENERIRAAV